MLTLFRVRPALLGSAALTCTLLLAGCSASSGNVTAGEASAAADGTCDGVEVVVNFGILDGTNAAECVEITSDSAPALDVVHDAGFETEGNAKYGDDALCRVQGLPSDSEPIVVPGFDPYTETCLDFAPIPAYWAIWVQPSAGAEWTYASEGMGTLTLKKGESIGLVFTTGDGTPAPVVE